MTEEDEFHISVIDYLELVLPKDCVVHHSPNEGKRGWNAQRKMKTHGTVAGWPDLELLYKGKMYFIELKTTKGRVRPVQFDCHQRLYEAGSTVFVCRSIDEVGNALTFFGIPARRVL